MAEKDEGWGKEVKVGPDDSSSKGRGENNRGWDVDQLGFQVRLRRTQYKAVDWKREKINKILTKAIARRE